MEDQKPIEAIANSLKGMIDQSCIGFLMVTQDCAHIS